MNRPAYADPPYEAWERAAASDAFEDAMDALEEVVQLLEGGNLRLNDAIRCYEIGNTLAKRCDRMLTDAELRITQLNAEPEKPDDTAPLPLFR